jgi:predicted protein tyrosine phosphatase
MPDAAPPPIRTLFICRQNRKRSATAERVFAKDPALDVRSAGTSGEALVRVNRRMLEWAEIVFVMDADLCHALGRMFPGHPALDRLVCLDIADGYPFLDPELVSRLEQRARPHLDSLRHARGE